MVDDRFFLGIFLLIIFLELHGLDFRFDDALFVVWLHDIFLHFFKRVLELSCKSTLHEDDDPNKPEEEQEDDEQDTSHPQNRSETS